MMTASFDTCPVLLGVHVQTQKRLCPNPKAFLLYCTYCTKFVFVTHFLKNEHCCYIANNYATLASVKSNLLTFMFTRLVRSNLSFTSHLLSCLEEFSPDTKQSETSMVVIQDKELQELTKESNSQTARNSSR